jgi:Na+-translocating ferredoxin:NAD+ oxidoreductase subunit C
MTKNVKSFPGGLHPPDSKAASAHKAIELCPLPDELVIHLSQHIGAPAVACVAQGDRVLKGQVIGAARGFVSVPVHASSSGEVTAVEPRPHASGNALPAVVLRPDGEDRWYEEPQRVEVDQLDFDALIERIRCAGIVGMGGATFPTHVKLSLSAEKAVDTLIINGAECEPYLTADHRLMLEVAESILAGINIIRRLVKVQRVCLAIENNKPDAIAHLRRVCRDEKIELVPLAVKYPQGAERQLVFAVTGREVPSGGLPIDVGVLVQNVGTAAAVADAVLRGTPLIESIVTVAGSAIADPKNLRVRIGTPLSHLVACCGGLEEQPAKIIMGGPMMGTAQLGLDVPTTRGTKGVLLFREKDLDLRPEGPCIRCGRCVRSCPVRIMPTAISAYGRLGRIDDAEKLNAMDCIECGCCTFTCPAHIPLVQSLRTVKAAILERRRND